MSAESADALHVGVGVAATCLGAVCSLYTCRCHVRGRLKGHTYAVAACAAALPVSWRLASWPLSSLGHHLARGVLVARLRRRIWATHRVAVPEMIRA
jgi:hypothetical protein